MAKLIFDIGLPSASRENMLFNNKSPMVVIANFKGFPTPVQNKFLTALAKIGPTSYLPFSKTRPKAYVKNNSTCPNDSTVASRKVQKIGK
jgi:hypothetical protein